MKKLPVIMAAVLFMLTVSPFVYADVIDIPRIEAFSDRHYSQVDFIDADEYIVRDECYMFSEPFGYETEMLQAGEILYVTAFYTDEYGKYWGRVERPDMPVFMGMENWLPMEMLEKTHDEEPDIIEESYTEISSEQVPETEIAPSESTLQTQITSSASEKVKTAAETESITEEITEKETEKISETTSAVTEIVTTTAPISETGIFTSEETEITEVSEPEPKAYKTEKSFGLPAGLAAAAAGISALFIIILKKRG